MSLTQVTVTATRENPDGTPASGRIVFTLSGAITNGGMTVEPSPIVGILSSGSLVNQSYEPLQLFALNDTGTTPVNPVPVFYLVTEEIDGAEVTEYSIMITASMAPSVGLDSLAKTGAP